MFTTKDAQLFLLVLANTQSSMCTDFMNMVYGQRCNEKMLSCGPKK